jgi:hypothetical protein
MYDACACLFGIRIGTVWHGDKLEERFVHLGNGVIIRCIDSGDENTAHALEEQKCIKSRWGDIQK